MKTKVMPVLFIALAVGGGSAMGALTGPDEWFAQLSKPSFYPPSWVFAPVWTFLYILIGIAGSRTWMRDRCGVPMKLWALQMFLNFLWSPVFFGLHRIDLALAVILLLLIAIVAYMWRVWPQDKSAAFLFFPYLAWVLFAAVLNAAFLWNNWVNGL